MKGISSPLARVNVGTFTRDISLATGTQAITGIGFKPKAIVIIAHLNNQASVGIDDGVTRGAWSIRDNFSALDNETNDSIKIRVSAGNEVEGDVSSFDADGFTINWVKSGSPTGTATIFFIAIG